MVTGRDSGASRGPRGQEREKQEWDAQHGALLSEHAAVVEQMCLGCAWPGCWTTKFWSQTPKFINLAWVFRDFPNGLEITGRTLEECNHRSNRVGPRKQDAEKIQRANRETMDRDIKEKELAFKHHQDWVTGGKSRSSPPMSALCSERTNGLLQ